MKQFFINGSTGLITANGTNHFNGIQNWCDADGPWIVSNETFRNSPFPYPGVIRNFRVKASANVTGATYVFRIRQNGANSSVVITVAVGTDGGTDTLNEVTVAAGDLICVMGTGTAGANNLAWSWSAEFEPTTTQRCIFTASSAGALSNTTGVTRYEGLQPLGTWNAALSSARRTVSPFDTTIESFYVAVSAAPGVGTSRAFTLFKNGIAEASSTISIADAATSASITGLSIDIARGDDIAIRCVNTGTSAGARAKWGVGFIPDIDGESPVFMQGANLTGAGGVSDTYLYLDGTGDGNTATEANHLQYSPGSFILKKFYALLHTAPGAGESVSIFARKNGVTSVLGGTAIDAETSISDTIDTLSFDAGDSVSLDLAFSDFGVAMDANLAFVMLDNSSSGPALPTTFPNSFNKQILRPLLSGHARAVWIGDSYAVPWLKSRLPHGWCLVGKMKNNRVWAYHAPCATSNLGAIAFTNHSGGTGLFTKAQSGNNWTLGGGDLSALPIGNQGAAFGDAALTLATSIGAHRKVTTIDVSNSSLSLGNNGVLVGPAESLKCRLLYYAHTPNSEIYTLNALYDSLTNLLATVNPATQARKYWSDGNDPSLGVAGNAVVGFMNAFYQDAQLPVGQASTIYATDAALIASSKYLAQAGFVLYRDGSDGYYHTAISDTSWSYSDLVTDVVTDGAGAKQYSDEELTRWLDVTTLDRNQPLYVVLHIADEDLTATAIRSILDSLRQRWIDVAADIGITSVKFLLVGGYLHFVTSSLTVEQTRTIIETNNLALYQFATLHPEDTAFVSLYAQTDGNLFMADDPGNISGNGAVPNGTNAASIAWLNAHGYSNWRLGASNYDLTDLDYAGVLTDDGIHISVLSSGSADSAVAAAFFADRMREAIEVPDEGHMRLNQRPWRGRPA